MPAGFMAKGKSGVIQIDGNYINYALVDKRSLVSQAVGSYGVSFNGVQVEVSGLSSLVAVHSTESVALVNTEKVSATSYMIELATLNTGAVIEVFIYRPQPPTPSTHGLQIFKPGKGLIFDALSKSMRVHSSQSGDYYSFEGDHALPVGRKYAVVFSQWCGLTTTTYLNLIGNTFLRTVRSTGPGYQFSTSQAKVTIKRDAGVGASATQFEGDPSNPPSGSAYRVPQLNVMICDVTDH